MNSVALIGNLTRNPELRYSTGNSQTAICRFSIAVNDGYGDNQKTSFIPIVTFGKVAENCDRYLSKGSRVAVLGRIQTGNYEKDGRTIYTTDVIAGNVEFLSHNQTQGQNQQNYGQYQTPQTIPQPQYQPIQQTVTQPQYPPQQPQTPQYQNHPQEPQQSSMGGFTALQDDDIPF